MQIHDYQEQIYAGVLGKIIGVYMGRPVEGWTYKDIRKTFGTVDYYVAHKTGAPFIVPDDDISGTFNFYRALEDNGFPVDVTAAQIGEAWLNYIIEDKTILWWGGLSRSTEHSAYLRLKQGYLPPLSGSGEMNGMVIAEQIGSQIFIDTWALVNPGNPARAAKMAREASVVSHDGIAVECAVYLAAMEAMAFDVKDLDQILCKCRQYIGDNAYGRQLNTLLDELFMQIDRTPDWRTMRDWIESNHGYEKYKGNCPMVTNHLAVLTALKFGCDDFRKSVSIAASCGWDTDCNAGNVGCFNAIRLGLSSIDADAELRAPVADRMYVVSTDGGDCVFDAVRETRKLLRAAAALNGESVTLPKSRYCFEYPGSVQGFMIHPESSFDQAAVRVSNAIATTGKPGLRVDYRGVSGSVKATVSVQTYVDPTPKAAPDTSYFEVYASPALYSGQTVHATFCCEQNANPDVRFFIDYYDAHDEIATMWAESGFPLHCGENAVSWKIPDCLGRSVYRLGFALESDRRKDGSIVLKSMDWMGTPERFHMGLAAELSPGISPFVTRTKWMMAFMNSTRHSGPSTNATFAISHPETNGLMTIGTTEWFDYSVWSCIQFVHARAAGLVARSKGHRQYYAAVFSQGKAQILFRKGADIRVLAQTSFPYEEGAWYDFRFAVSGSRLTMYIDGSEVLACNDDTYHCGAAGYLVDEGAVVAKCFAVESLETR